MALVMRDAVGPTGGAHASPSGTAAPSDARQYLRGSGMLLAGRVVAVVLNTAVQVLTVRYLTKGDYGAFAYALGVVTLGSQVVLLGLGKAIPRLAPVYREQHDYARAFGSIALAAGTVWGLGLSLVLLVHGVQGMLDDIAGADPKSVSLLLVLVALAPVEALDHLLQHVVAVFCGPRPIVLRRQVLGPAFKLATVLVVMLVAGDVYALAYGYLLGGLIGVVLYLSVLVRRWRRDGQLQYLRPGRLDLPVRETFGFSLPLLASELSIILRGSIAILLLEYYMASQEVAEYRAVLPVAGMNMLVAEAFGYLFVPLASRLFARSDHAGVNELYWSASLWIAVLTFPLFALTCVLATEVTVWMFGATYQEAGTLLALLAAAYYFNAALGFNAATLRVYGRLRTIVVNDIIAAACCLIAGVVLIQRYGALGAAISTSGTLVLQNLLNHFGLWATSTGVRLVDTRLLRTYAVIAFLIVTLLAVDWAAAVPTTLDFALAAAASVVVVWVTRPVLKLTQTFPELHRVPVMRWLFS